MVKLQKPIPKKLGNKAQLDNPIKSKKQQIKKEKCIGTLKNIDTKLLKSPIKHAKVVNKPFKGGLKNELIVKKSKEVPKGRINGKSKPASPIKSSQRNDGQLRVKKGEQIAASVKAADPGEVVAKGKVASVQPAVVVKIAPAAKVASVKPAPVQITAFKSAAPAKLPAKVLPVKSTLPAKVDTVKHATLVKVAVSKKTAPKKTEIPVKKQTPQLPPKGSVSASKPKQGKKKNKKAVTTVVDSGTTVEEPKVEKKIRKLQEKKIKKIIFQKAKRASAGKTVDEKQEMKERFGVRFEPAPYDEEKFNAIVTQESITKITAALKTQVENDVATKKSTIFEDYQYFLQVGSFKIANCPKRMVKLNLKHPLVDKDDDVLLVVPDLQRGAKVDYEPTVHHWEDLLRVHGVEGIKVMPMNQIRKEYGTFELKRRLLASYDYFLCDGRIVGHVTALIGKICQKPRHTFHAVRLHEEKNIKQEIEKSMRRTAYRQVSKATLQTIPVGTHKFTSQQVAENVVFVVSQLKKHFPGGMGNVRNLYVKIGITGTCALPLYISMAQAPEQTPTIVGPREQRMTKLKREANEVLSKFAMTKEGKLIKLTKADAEKKRNLQEMKAALKEEGAVPAKKLKKNGVNATPKAEEMKELELPENEKDDDDDSSDDDVVQLARSSDDEEDDSDDMGQLDQEQDEASIDAENDSEIVENGLVDEDSEAEDEQQDDDKDEDADDDDDEGAEESD